MAVVIEAAMFAQALVERVLSRVAERGVAKVMAERDGFGEIVIECECAGERSGELGDLDRVRQARAEMVSLVVYENLRLVGEAAKRARMNDAVTVALEGRTRR